MPSLPIPLISSLVLAFLLVRFWRHERRLTPLAGLLALCAAQGAIIALAQHYRVPGMALVQPLTATLIPPAAWCAFQITAVRAPRVTDVLHLLGFALVCLALFIRPVLIDTLIPLLFAGYGAALLWAGTRGADQLPRARLAAGDLPRRIWQVIGAALIGSALSDVLIIAAQIAGAAYLQPWIISIYSSAMLLIIGGLSLSDDLRSAPPPPDPPAPEQSAQDQDVMTRLDALMAQDKPYLNPDLTLAHLARKLRLPVKQLSGTINRTTGENVSRYVNAARIGAAQSALREGENVTNAMLSAGFNTKSNFNREFARITGQSPSDWLAAQEG